MNEVISNILTRRSVRSYSPRQITDEHLSAILEAARYSPTGGNSQSWHFTVVQNADIIKEINTALRTAFARMEETPGMYRSKAASIRTAKGGHYCFYYGAPTIVIVSNERTYPNAMADCAAALQTMFLAAHSLAVGSCWLNPLHWCETEPELRAIYTRIGVPESHMVCGGTALGYPEGAYPSAPARKPDVWHIVK